MGTHFLSCEKYCRSKLPTSPAISLLLEQLVLSRLLFSNSITDTKNVVDECAGKLDRNILQL